MQVNWQEIQKLLIVVEDTHITPLQPALHRIKAALTAEITLLSSRSEDEIVNYIPSTTNWRDVAREKELVEKLRPALFDAVIIFTDDLTSPYPIAYLCYLAGIAIRIGQSREFGGSVLSHWVKPPLDELSPSDRHLYLLDAISFPVVQPLQAIAQH